MGSKTRRYADSEGAGEGRGQVGRSEGLDEDIGRANKCTCGGRGRLACARRFDK